jgi:hypothetical protein
MDIILKRRTISTFIGVVLSSIAFLYCAANYPSISLAAACCLLVFFMTLCFKEKVFLAFIFLYPFIPSYLAFDLGGAFPLVKISRLVVIYVILFDLIFNRDKFRKFKEITLSKDIKIIIFSILFLLFTLIQNFLAYPDAESFKILISFISEEVLLSVYIFFRAAGNGDVDKTVKCFISAAFFIAIMGIFEFLLRVNMFSFFDIVKTNRQLLSSDVYARLGENRIEGPFGHPLAYCNFLLMTIPLGIYEWQTSKEIKVKTVYFAITLLLLLNLFLTLSRGPILAFIIGASIYFICTNRRSKQIIFMLASVFSGVLLIGLITRALPGFIRNFLVSVLDSVLMRNTVSGFGANADASTYRLYLFDFAKKLVGDDYIWIGRGISFFRLNEVYDSVPGMYGKTQITSVDNYYILKYIEMGLMGIFSTFVFIFSLIYSCIINFLKAINREFALCFLFIIISYFISLFTVDEIGTFRFMWIITGILAAKISLNHVANEKDEVNAGI